VIDFIPFSRPSMGLEEEHAIAEVLRSGWLTTGPRCAAFESEFATRVEAKHALALTSATAGLHIAMAAMSIGSGDEVITPSFTWCSTPNVVRLLGAKPVFVDVDPDTLSIDLEDVKRVLTPRTKAVVPVHYAGRAYEIHQLRDILSNHAAVLIDDAAHALGTVYKGCPIGSLADISCFSFHPIKNITTGEGGMLTYNDTDLDKKLRLWKFHGVTRDAYARYSSKALSHYDIVFPGLKYNMTDIQAALGLIQLKKLDQFNERRRYLAERYHTLLADLPIQLPPLEKREGYCHAWHLFVIRVLAEAPVKRDDLVLELSERNIGTGFHYLPVHTATAYSDFYRELPVTETVGQQVISLPLYPDLTDAQQDYVAEQIRSILSV